MALPEPDLTRVRRWGAARVPEHAHYQVRVECEITPRHLTIVERRARGVPTQGRSGAASRSPGSATPRPPRHGHCSGETATCGFTSTTCCPTAVAVSSDDVRQGPGGSNDTPVTGDELARVTAAVQAKDPSFTVSSLRKDPDGSYDVFGTKSGAPAGYDVSADLQTITESTGHGGGRGGSNHTPVTGDELARVTA